MSTPYSCILFDLDGTIVDSAPGITATLAYMFEQLGRPIPTPSELLKYVGPPLLDSFRDYARFDAAQSAEALAIYREKYLNVGAYDATQYPGVGLVLKAVHESPVPMSLATSKPETPATLILEHFNLARYFDIRLAAMGADISRPVLVGDREHDVQGAAANGVPTIFVEWGYGSIAEQAGSVAVVSTPEELQTLLLG
jgi:phosphoglycolate phosphatase